MSDLREKCKRTGEMDTSNVTEFTKYASSKWKVMDDGDKKPWNERAELDKKRYEKEMETYQPPPGMGGRGSRKKAKDPYAPKKPKSGYLFFLDYFRGSHPELNHKEVVSKGAEQWSSMNDEQKLPYQQMHEQAKTEYSSKMAAMSSY
jgi:hypothetical protein